MKNMLINLVFGACVKYYFEKCFFDTGHIIYQSIKLMHLRH